MFLKSNISKKEIKKCKKTKFSLTNNYIEVIKYENNNVINFEKYINNEIGIKEHRDYIEHLIKDTNIKYIKTIEELNNEYYLEIFNKLYDKYQIENMDVDNYFKNYTIPLIKKSNEKTVTGFLYPTANDLLMGEEIVFVDPKLINKLYGLDKLDFLGLDRNTPLEVIDLLLEYMIKENISDFHINPLNEYNYYISSRIFTKYIIMEKEIKNVIANSLIHALFILSNRDKHSMKKSMRSTISYKSKTGEEYRFRVHMMFKDTSPTKKGYGVSIRLLPKESSLKSLKNLSYLESTEKKIKKIVEVNKNGLIVISGATNSGKTTLLYALLKYINKELNRKVDTIESPIEMYIEGLNQTDLMANSLTNNPMSIEEAIKELLSQDSDVTLISEARDNEEIKWTIELSKKGHLTFTTLHAGNVKETLNILKDNTQNKDDINNNIRMIINQELIEKLCQSCKGKKCKKCDNVGYSGVLPLYEIMFYHNIELDDDLTNYQNLMIEEKGFYISKEEIMNVYYDLGYVSFEQMKAKSNQGIFEILEIDN